MTFEVFMGIECRTDVLGGKPIIAGTRIPVWQILHSLLYGESPSDVAAQFDELELQDISNAVEFAEMALSGGMKHPSLRLTASEREWLLSALKLVSRTENKRGRSKIAASNDDAKTSVSKLINYFDRPWIPVRA